VAATRCDEAEFSERTPLGTSLRRLRFDSRLSSTIAYRNTRGLPEIYNEAIRAASGETLVFVHDDVWLEDFFLADRLEEALSVYDVIGVAGNRRRVPNQWAWAFKSTAPDVFPRPLDVGTWDVGNLSGAVAHGPGFLGTVTSFGPVPAPCEILDGVFLAARTARLRSSGVLFDPRFQFHFYDLDFCRTARTNGLRLGTWRIPITHASNGSYTSPQWLAGRDTYRLKWGD
jgi:GT2 family glycosyltransferase